MHFEKIIIFSKISINYNLKIRKNFSGNVYLSDFFNCKQIKTTRDINNICKQYSIRNN